MHVFKAFSRLDALGVMRKLSPSHGPVSPEGRGGEEVIPG